MTTLTDDLHRLRNPRSSDGLRLRARLLAERRAELDRDKAEIEREIEELEAVLVARGLETR